VVSFWREVYPRNGDEVAIVGHRCSLAVLRACVTGESLEEAFSTQLGMGQAVVVVPSS
jgi:broad specificity phosphatase PhoE